MNFLSKALMDCFADQAMTRGFERLQRNDEWQTRLAKGLPVAVKNPGSQVNITCPDLDLACACVHLASRVYRDYIDHELTKRAPATQIEFKNGSCIVFKIEPNGAPE